MNDGKVGQPLRILAVEDEALILMLLQDLIADLGHTCALTATRNAEAMEAAQRGDFDLAILDVNLRGETSFGIADILASRGLPFVFATGYGAQGIEARFSEVPILQKPFDETSLRTAIAAATRARGD